MRGLVVALAFGALTVGGLAGCSTAPEPPPPAPPPPAPEPAPTPPPVTDTCGAQEHQHLVGEPRSRIPVPANPDLQRVACTTCPITMDHNPRRLNFFYDAQTGIIREVRCG